MLLPSRPRRKPQPTIHFSNGSLSCIPMLSKLCKNSKQFKRNRRATCYPAAFNGAWQDCAAYASKYASIAWQDCVAWTSASMYGPQQRILLPHPSDCFDCFEARLAVQASSGLDEPTSEVPAQVIPKMRIESTRTAMQSRVATPAAC